MGLFWPETILNFSRLPLLLAEVQSFGSRGVLRSVSIFRLMVLIDLNREKKVVMKESRGRTGKVEMRG